MKHKQTCIVSSLKRTYYCLDRNQLTHILQLYEELIDQYGIVYDMHIRQNQEWDGEGYSQQMHGKYDIEFTYKFDHIVRRLTDRTAKSRQIDFDANYSLLFQEIDKYLQEIEA